MPRQWRKKHGFEAVAARSGPSFVVERLLAQRGIQAADRERFIAPQYDRDLHDPFLFRDMERVVERIRMAGERNEKIGVFGDFDADGVTASVIIREALEALGLSVVIHIPHKLREGHGLSSAAVERFSHENVRLILTLDCGMMSHAEIAAAKAAGIETIVIDHHHVPPVLPEAFAIINPKLPEETYPFRDLCGAGTAFKVATALFRRLLPEREEELKWLLDVAAIGTVADVMPLIGENRVLVKYGLIVLQKTRRPGLRELYHVGRIPIDDRHAPDARMIAFQIAPRINAASRMAHAQTAHDLLVTADAAHARVLALELESYNTARQKVSQAAALEVQALATSQFADKKYILAIGEGFPLGVVGLVAGRVAHELGKPTGVFQRGETTSTGSFRSIEGFSIVAALEACADLLEKFGGHEQAAGMTIRNDRWEAFHERFDAYVNTALRTVDTVPVLDIDLALHPTDLSLELVQAIDDIAPFGEGNPEPVFLLSGFEIAAARKVGKEGKHWKFDLRHPEGGERIDAVGWTLVPEHPDLDAGQQITVACQLSANTWNGSTALQLKLVDVREGAGLFLD
jgi:single-stranded-DNA-specific exonuclease